MSKELQAKLGVIASAFVLMLSLAAFFIGNASTAWLAQNDSASGNLMSVNISEELTVSASLKCYGVTEISSDGNVYTVPAADSSGSRVESYELPVIDPNGITYSEYEKALLVIIDVQTDEDTEISVSACADNASGALADIVAEQNYFSNSVIITPALFDDETSSATKNGAAQQFTTHMGEESFAKSGELVFPDVTVQAGGGQAAFIIEYNEPVISFATEYILYHNYDYFEIFYNNDVHFLIAKSN